MEGYVPSPGERSYDSLGLMKQLSEQTAPAYANAREVLGDETPDSLLKKRLLQTSESSRQDSNILVCSVLTLCCSLSLPVLMFGEKKDGEKEYVFTTFCVQELERKERTNNLTVMSFLLSFVIIKVEQNKKA